MKLRPDEQYHRGHWSSLDGGSKETTVFRVKVVEHNGHTTELVFPLFERDKAITAMLQFMQVPDMSFVSMGKEAG